MVRAGQAAIASIFLAFAAEPALACFDITPPIPDPPPPSVWVTPHGDLDQDGLNEFWIGVEVDNLFSITTGEICQCGLDILNKLDIVFDVQEAELVFVDEDTQEARAVTDVNGNSIFDFALDPTDPLSNSFRGGFFSATVQPFDASAPQLQAGANEKLKLRFKVEADHPTLAGGELLIGAGSTNPTHPFEIATTTVPGNKTPEPSVALTLLALSSGALALRKKTKAS